MKCPRCGSTNSAYIEYGLPAIDENFNLRPDIQKRLDRKEIILGGCCKLKNSPKRMCLDCKFKYLSEPYYVSGDDVDLREKASYYDYRNTIKSFYFCCSRRFNEKKYVLIKNDNDDFTVSTHPSSIKRKEEIIKRLTNSEWYNFFDQLYSNYLLHEWDKEYVDCDVLDGIQWEIQIVLNNGREIEYHGSNKFPSYWEEFISFINGFMLFSGEHF